jgi:uncharacterized membrane-anchored protein
MNARRWLLRGVVAVQIAFFAIWGRSLIASFEPRPAGDDGEGTMTTVWLATEPVDPRDLLSGHFVALRYGMADPEHAKCNLSTAADRVYVELAPSGTGVQTAEGEVETAQAVGCRTATPPSDNGHAWIAADVERSAGSVRLIYGIERMYVPETSPLRDARSGEVVAKVAINADFEPRILGLVAMGGGGEGAAKPAAK